MEGKQLLNHPDRCPMRNHLSDDMDRTVLFPGTYGHWYINQLVDLCTYVCSCVLACQFHLFFIHWYMDWLVELFVKALFDALIHGLIGVCRPEASRLSVIIEWHDWSLGQMVLSESVTPQSGDWKWKDTMLISCFLLLLLFWSHWSLYYCGNLIGTVVFHCWTL